MPLVQSNPTPLYFQVQDDLARRIRSGQFRREDPLPNEQDLCKFYDVSRVTLRKAIDGLVEANLVVRKRGLGTFLASGPAQFKFRGLLDDMMSVKERDREFVRDEQIVPAPDVADLLQTDPDNPVRRCDILVREDGKTIAYTSYHIAPVVGALPSIDDVHAAGSFSLAIQKSSGMQIVCADLEVAPVAAAASVAHYLGIDPGTPILESRRVYFTGDGQVTHVALACYHPGNGRYRFRLFSSEPRTSAG